MEALRFEDGSAEPLRNISESGWVRLLAICDKEQLTLPLLCRRADFLPVSIAGQMESRLIKNEERVRRVGEAYTEIASEFSRAGLEAAVLKGFSQYPDFVPDIRYRVQYDIDFFCADDAVYQARDCLLALGYESLAEMRDFPTDHLPVMIRKTGWRWRGDFFDPEIPVSVDLHFRFWDECTEQFRAEGVEQFWRRTGQRTGGSKMYRSLNRTDALAYHCLHLLRHMLRGNLRVSHVYELAWFLQHHRQDDGFWHDWQIEHSKPLRRLQAIGFELARRWFGCDPSVVPAAEIANLPKVVNSWFERYSFAPIENLFVPNKHELWLHMALIETGAGRRSVFRRRLFPTRLPGPVDSVYVPNHQLSTAMRVRKAARYTAHLSSRAIRHARVLPSTGWHAAVWQFRDSGLTLQFWQFIAAACLLNFGAFIFFLIYNLYLLDSGFREDFIGLMNGAFTAGSLAGSLPAGALLQRFGTRRTVQVCSVGIAAVSAFRAIATGSGALIGLAFLGGIAFSIWAVTIAPAIAQLTAARARPAGFSLFFGIAIATGVLGGLAGGRLPDALAEFAAAAAIAPKQAALLAGCVFSFAAIWPAARLPGVRQARHARPKYPISPFVRRYLLALAGFNLAVGAFNPFFNTFFARKLSAGTEQIGLVFSAGQVAQVVAMMMAPFVLRKLGLIRGVMATQIATGVALIAVALSSTVWAGAFAYAAYAACQYMSEPGINTLLMSRVEPDEQSGASSLNFLAAFSAHAVAAMAAGAALSRFGYQPVIAALAAVVIVSALLFRVLLRGFEVPFASHD
jgi:MFS family permease